MPSRAALRGHGGQAPGMLKGAMGQPDRRAVCPRPPATRFVSWRLVRQTPPPFFYHVLSAGEHAWVQAVLQITSWGTKLGVPRSHAKP